MNISKISFGICAYEIAYIISKAVKYLQTPVMFSSFLEHEVEKVRPEPGRLLSLLNQNTHPRERSNKAGYIPRKMTRCTGKSPDVLLLV